MISRRNIAAISGIILSAAALAAVPTMPDDDGAKSQCRQHVACDMDDADTRWKINEEGQIEWDVKAGEVPHSDHFEMSGEQIACVLRWALDEASTLTTERSLVFPMLRRIPNDTHASLMHRVAVDIPSLLSVDGLALKDGRTEKIIIDGAFYSEETWSVGRQNTGTGSGTAPVPAVKLTRTIFPSVDKPVLYERFTLQNLKDRKSVFYIPEYSQKFRTLAERGKDGVYVIEVSIAGNGTFVLGKGESIAFDVVFSGHVEGRPVNTGDAASELDARRAFVENDMNGALVLETPDSVINTMFRYAKIRACESICKTAGGYMHAPGGESYYAAIWANDQAEYVNPFFPYTGYRKGCESAINSFRHFARFMNPEYKPLPSSIIAEGTDIWDGAGDRGDAAMIAYGASRFALANADRDEAEELWSLIEWCLEYCRRQLNPQGVVVSDTDELEGRFEAGDANLCTSSLYYDALNSAACLAKALGKPASVAKSYLRQAAKLKKNIEKYFGADIEGFHTYRYYDGNTLLRSWICIPLTVGIYDRAEGTAEALCSPLLWKEDGLLTEQGSATFWDRSTLYALRGIYAAGMSDTATKKLHEYSERRLLGNHVPYAIEAWPEGSQRHLSAESGLYCRIITEGMFGIRPTGFESFTMTPSLPSCWDRMSLRRIKAFGHDFDIVVSRTGEDMLEIRIKTSSEEKTFAVGTGGSIHVEL